MRGSAGAILRRGATLVLLAAAGLSSRSARGADAGGGDSPWNVQVHAFASQGFLLTTHNDYIDTNSTHGTFQFSEVGINFRKAFFADRLRIGIQLFAQDLGPGSSFSAQMDWFSLDYRWADWLGFRAGRLKIPYGLYNEVNDIDSARVPVLLPQSVYPLQARDFLFAQNGGELYGFVRLPDLGALEYRLYGGTIFINPALAIPPGSPVQLQFPESFVGGGRLFWETPLEGLRVGGTVEGVHIDSTAFIGTTTSVSLPNDTYAWLASAEFVGGDLTMTAEYGRGHTSQGTSNAMIQPPITQTSEGGYAMVTYRPVAWFNPGAYYAVAFPDVTHRDGRENHQHDLALVVRYDVNDHWLVKLEGHYMAGTAGLANPLRVGPLPTKADPTWGVFLVKTTGYF